jgi:hypothetical protein
MKQHLISSSKETGIYDADFKYSRGEQIRTSMLILNCCFLSVTSFPHISFSSNKICHVFVILTE